MTPYHEDQLRRLREVTAILGTERAPRPFCAVARMGVALSECPPVWLELQELGLVKVWCDESRPSYIYVAAVE